MTATTSKNLEERFDAGEDVTDYFDLEQPIVENLDPMEPKNISVTIPLWLMQSFDDEASRRGIARKAMINTALVEWTDEHRARMQRLNAQ